MVYEIILIDQAEKDIVTLQKENQSIGSICNKIIKEFHGDGLRYGRCTK